MNEAMNSAARKYIKGSGGFCPFCKDGDPEVMSGLEIDGSIVTRKMLCLACKEGWHEVYELTEIVTTRYRQAFPQPEKRVVHITVGGSVVQRVEAPDDCSIIVTDWEDAREIDPNTGEPIDVVRVWRRV